MLTQTINVPLQCNPLSVLPPCKKVAICLQSEIADAVESAHIQNVSGVGGQGAMYGAEVER